MVFTPALIKYCKAAEATEVFSGEPLDCDIRKEKKPGGILSMINCTCEHLLSSFKCLMIVDLGEQGLFHITHVTEQ